MTRRQLLLLLAATALTPSAASANIEVQPAYSVGWLEAFYGRPDGPWDNGGANPMTISPDAALRILGAPDDVRTGILAEIATEPELFEFQPQERVGVVMVSGAGRANASNEIMANPIANVHRWPGSKSRRAKLWRYRHSDGVVFYVIICEVCGNLVIDFELPPGLCLPNEAI